MSALNRSRSRSQVLAGATPRVSLLPPSQRAALKHEKTLPKLLLMIVASAAVAALIAGAGFVTAMFAQQRLDVLDAESNALITQLAEFGEVQQLLSRSQTLTSLRQEATGEEVMFIDLRDEIALGLPEGSALVGFSASNGVVDPAAAEVPSLCGPGAAKLTVTIRSAQFAAAADLIDSMSSVTGYECAMATSSTVDAAAPPVEGEEALPSSVTTIIELTVNDEARSTRFAAKEAN